MPALGLAKTYCVDAQVPDDACSATALLCGVKGRAGVVGMAPSVRRDQCNGQNHTAHHISSLLRWAQEAGKATGVVTSGRVTQPTAAAAYAHAASSAWECDADVEAAGVDEGQACPDVAAQLVSGQTGRQLKVVMGGGREMFLSPSTAEDETESSGRRLDGRNLIQEWTADKNSRAATSAYITKREQLFVPNTTQHDYILGLFSESELPFHLDAAPNTVPRLSEMTRTAIEVLQKQENGFILLVCGALIDKAHDLNLAQKALDETLELEKALQVALEMTNESDTLVVVTADYSSSLSFSGSQPRGNDILGVAGADAEGTPYTSLSYVSGPGYRHPRTWSDVTHDNTHEKDFAFPAMRPAAAAGHGGEDALVLSRGPWAHLLTGTFEQHYVPHAVAFAACLGDGTTACSVARAIDSL